MSGRYYTALCLLQTCHVLFHLVQLPDALPPPLPPPPAALHRHQPERVANSLVPESNSARGAPRLERDDPPPAYRAMLRAWGEWRAMAMMESAEERGEEERREGEKIHGKSARCPVPPREQQLCALRHLADDSGTELLDAESPLPWPGALPARSLARSLEAEGRRWKRCAVVANSASLLAAEMGAEIDSHDAVLRFNTAPTTGYERHVGSKTTVRLINSMVVTRKKFNFHTDPLYKDVILVLWDTPPPNCDVSLWYRNRNAPFFDAYVAHRRQRPGQHFYLLHPRFVRGAWGLVQENLGMCHARQTPTSSGFLGVMLMMSLCEEVDVYDYIPPQGRASRRCHYFEPGDDPACSMGGRHPITSEKLFALRLSAHAAERAFSSGRLHLPGLNKLTCPH
ncbi:beta-galactoside alpha-2,6-sialyltransferase 2-like [Lethenteron reissneri]|uniref:beta-galactoside alpha-2,6-sialyltransferase 2-like n=1 Tax=Lethenteron reissneri TaxID=7753 RepID=UPI002AB725E5|nr:beta-galactoside alpha-2,6-sialyltransferase 2-like [Lethenteron reissneri]